MTEKVDVFSFGICLWEIWMGGLQARPPRMPLSAASPHLARALLAEFRAHMQAPLPCVRMQLSLCDPQLTLLPIVHACMHVQRGCIGDHAGSPR